MLEFQKRAELAFSAKEPNGSTDLSLTAGPVRINAMATLANNLFSPTVEAKLWATATKFLCNPEPPRFYPEYTKPRGSDYVYRDFRFWTSGFFPGCLYELLYRKMRLSGVIPYSQQPGLHEMQLSFACDWWTEALHENASLQGTHDLGFMIMPWARPAWELKGDSRALKTMITAAGTLATRFNDRVGTLRSWDVCKTAKYDFHDTKADFLVIIDNLMNLDMLFYVAKQTKDHSLYTIARSHALTTLEYHVRHDGSTTHLVNFDQSTGQVKERLTNQGFAHGSCWSRGQAWAIAGFAETYHWTGDDAFLTVSRRCADYFIDHLPPSHIAPWDFDAAAAAAAGARDNTSSSSLEPPDTSATLIAAYGMLLIHRAIGAGHVHASSHSSRYLTVALRMVEAVCQSHMNPECRLTLVPWPEDSYETVEEGLRKAEGRLTVTGGLGGGDSIINGATINNYEFAPRRWADHGLVYADYYFLRVGNELAGLLPEMGNNIKT